MSEALERAKKAYRSKSLKNMSLQFSQHDTDSYQALCELEQVYGSASRAIKQALIEHVKQLNGQDR